MSVVMAVAGMDAYFTNKYCDILVPILKRKPPGKDLIDVLENAGFNTGIALELMVMKRPFRRIRKLVETSFSTYTTHRTDKIDELFRSIGLKNLSANAQKKVGRRNLLRRVQILVDLRNSIAHGAHLDSRGKPKQIHSSKIEKYFNDLEKYISACDEIIENFAK